MGDNAIEKEKEKPTDLDSVSASSLKPLRSVRPSENIAIADEPPRPSEEEVLLKTESAAESVAKVETFFEKPLEPTFSENKKLVENSAAKLELDQSEAVIKTEDPPEEVKPSTPDLPSPTVLEKKSGVASESSGLIQIERIVRNQSDIFSLKEQTDVASEIFSINGSPSRKVFRRKEVVASNVFPFGQIDKDEPRLEKVASPRAKVRDAKETYNELTRPSGSARNPLTGTGLTSNDEYKCKGSKRKDGNPLLGLGYSPEVTPSSHRIPPGGFSHKLW